MGIITLEVYNTYIAPNTDAGLDIGILSANPTSSKQFKDIYITGLAYIDGFGEDTDMGDFNISSVGKLYGFDDDMFINMGENGRLSIVANAPGSPFNIPDITLSGSSFLDDDTGLDSNNRILFTDTEVLIRSPADGVLELGADIGHEFRPSGDVDGSTNTVLNFKTTTNSGQLQWRQNETHFLFLDSAKFNGVNIGFFSKDPLPQAQVYNVFNRTENRSLDVLTIGLAELANVAGTLINDLSLYGLLPLVVTSSSSSSSSISSSSSSSISSSSSSSSNGGGSSSSSSSRSSSSSSSSSSRSSSSSSSSSRSSSSSSSRSSSSSSSRSSSSSSRSSSSSSSSFSSSSSSSSSRSSSSSSSSSISSSSSSSSRSSSSSSSSRSSSSSSSSSRSSSSSSSSKSSSSSSSSSSLSSSSSSSSQSSSSSSSSQSSSSSSRSSSSSSSSSNSSSSSSSRSSSSSSSSSRSSSSSSSSSRSSSSSSRSSSSSSSSSQSSSSSSQSSSSSSSSSASSSSSSQSSSSSSNSHDGIDGFTVLMLKMDGVDGSTSFPDISNTPHTITAKNGAEIDTDEGISGDSSGLFTGATAYVDAPSHADWDWTTVDMTWEARIRFTSFAGNQVIFGRPTSGGSYFYWQVQETIWRFRDYNGSNIIDFTRTVSTSLNTWYHVAVTRSGSNFRMFLDGVQQGATAVDASSFVDRTGTTLEIASNSVISHFFNGHMDEVRISKGIARWTANFTVPDPYGSSSSSSSSRSSSSSSRSSSSSSSSSVSSSSSSRSSSSSSSSSSSRSSSSSSSSSSSRSSSSSSSSLSSSSSSSSLSSSSSSSLSSSSSSSSSRSSSSSSRSSSSSSSSSSSRSSSSSSRSSSSSSLSSSSSSSLSTMGIDPFTVLMLHMNGTDESTTFTDDSFATQHTMTAQNGAEIDTAESVFGSASGLFTGATAYVDTPDNVDFTWGTADMTWEARIRFTSFTGNQVIMGRPTSGGSYMYWQVQETAIRFRDYNGSNIIDFTKTYSALSLNTWYHFVVTRSGSNFRFFLDGVQQGTTTSDASAFVVRTGTTLQVGANSVISHYFNGHIDEFRISKGVARWTANFTPPTTEYATP